MVKLVRGHSTKLDKPLREAILDLYKPFRFTPCFLHRFLEKRLQTKQKLSVIIEFERTAVFFHSFLMEQLLNGHGKSCVRNRFSSISCCSAYITPERLEFILSHCPSIKRIYLNRKIKALRFGHKAQKPGQPTKNTPGVLTGKGVTIAIIDTGVFQHEDLAGRISGFVDFINGRANAYDDNGHGTHCAGIAAGNGLLSNGTYNGMAPEANIIGIKVLDRTGTGTIESIIQGVEWCIKYNQNHPSHPIHIISLSLGTHATKYMTEQDDPIVRMVEEAWKSGITVVTAAGNDGPDPFTIASPGVSEEVITVGSLDTSHIYPSETFNTAPFSSRGPTIYGKRKPDLLAPGVDLISLRTPGSFIDRFQKSNRHEKHYTKMSGTSMSTPFCAGAAAMLLQSDVSLTPSMIKQLLVEGTSFVNADGVGQIDVERSLDLLRRRNV